MLTLKAQQAPWRIREVNGKYLVMATGKNVLSTLHENVLSTLHENIWLWQWMKGIAEMSCCHNCTLLILTFAHLEKMTNKVSTRCKICNQRPREKMRSHLICLLFVVRNHLCICVCICNLFLEGGTKVKKKKIDILKKWRGEKRNKMWV